MREHWRHWQKARRAHDEALNQAREQNEKEELLRFQLEELDALALQDGELEQLEQEQQRLGNAESLIRVCQQSLNALYEGEDGTCNDHLSQVSHWLDDARNNDDGLGSIADTVESARLQVEAAADDLRHYLEKLDLDPARLSQVEERLSQCYTLARKHRIRPEELVEHHRSLLAESDALGNVDAHLHALAEQETRPAALHGQRPQLSKARRSAAKTLSQQVQKQLTALGMKAAQLDARLSECSPTSRAWKTWNSCFPPTRASRSSRWARWRPVANCRGSAWPFR